MSIPSRKVVAKLYILKTDQQIAEQFSVSGSTVRRWRRIHRIASKPRGPRAKRNSKISDQKLSKAVEKSFSVAGVLRSLGFSETGTQHRNMKERIRSLGLDTLHFGKSKSILGSSGYRADWAARLKKGTKVSNGPFKQWLYAEKLLPEECQICGQGPEWNGSGLTIQLDHIDGDPTNNELLNLRSVCPNCHSQTPTWCGRNKAAKSNS